MQRDKRGQVHPWKQWFNQRVLDLRKGKHFTCRTDTMIQQVRQQAKNHGVYVSIRAHDDGLGLTARIMSQQEWDGYKDDRGMMPAKAHPRAPTPPRVPKKRGRPRKYPLEEPFHHPQPTGGSNGLNGAKGKDDRASASVGLAVHPTGNGASSATESRTVPVGSRLSVVGTGVGEVGVGNGSEGNRATVERTGSVPNPTLLPRTNPASPVVFSSQGVRFNRPVLVGAKRTSHNGGNAGTVEKPTPNPVNHDPTEEGNGAGGVYFLQKESAPSGLCQEFLWSDSVGIGAC